MEDIFILALSSWCLCRESVHAYACPVAPFVCLAACPCRMYGHFLMFLLVWLLARILLGFPLVGASRQVQVTHSGRCEDGHLQIQDPTIISSDSTHMATSEADRGSSSSSCCSSSSPSSSSASLSSSEADRSSTGAEGSPAVAGGHTARAVVAERYAGDVCYHSCRGSGS